MTSRPVARRTRGQQPGADELLGAARAVGGADVQVVDAQLDGGGGGGDAVGLRGGLAVGFGRIVAS
jgi:hypothetical protein